jgi:hypothetical protein
MTQTLSTEAPFLPTVPEVERVVAQIRSAVEHGKPMAAANMERAMWEGVLEAVASGNAQAGYLAAAALESKKIDFPRY